MTDLYIGRLIELIQHASRTNAAAFATVPKRLADTLQANGFVHLYGSGHSVLSEFRARVAAGGLDQVVLDRLLERLAADGLAGAGGAMRTDSTHVISAVRDLNRLELAGESVRACLEQLAVAAPQVVAQLLDDSWAQRYAARADTWRMPAATTRKEELALAYGRDGRILLKAVYAAAASDPDLAFLARLRQVEVLRVVLLQNYLTVTGEQGREVIRDLPGGRPSASASRRLITPRPPLPATVR